MSLFKQRYIVRYTIINDKGISVQREYKSNTRLDTDLLWQQLKDLNAISGVYLDTSKSGEDQILAEF